MNDATLVKLYGLAKCIRELNGSSQYVLRDGVLMRLWCDRHRPSDLPIKQIGFPDNSAQDNSAWTIRRWTIRRGQFGSTIRLGQFGAKYDINFIESSAFIQQYSFHQSRFYFSNILFFNPASNSAIFFSSMPLLFQQYFFD